MQQDNCNILDNYEEYLEASTVRQKIHSYTQLFLHPHLNRYDAHFLASVRRDVALAADFYTISPDQDLLFALFHVSLRTLHLLFPAHYHAHEHYFRDLRTNVNHARAEHLHPAPPVDQTVYDEWDLVDINVFVNSDNF